VAIIAAVVSVAAIPVGIIATATPALASGFTICTASGHHYCIGASTLRNGDPVQSTAGGRQINLVDQHFKSHGREVFRLHFAAAPTLCVGVENVSSPSNKTVKSRLRDCSNGNGANVNWVEVPQSGDSVKLYSVTWGAYLTSLNTRGSQLIVTTCGSHGGSGCNGVYLKWVFT
jgi:hypothetical protein